MFKYYNPKLIHSKRSYTVEKLCNLYKSQKLHAQTIRNWVNFGQLEVISKKPIIIHGAVIKSFLEHRNNKHKKTLKIDQIKCLKCKKISHPKNKEITLYQNKNKSWKGVCFCDICGNKVWRFYKQNQLTQLEKIFAIKQPKLMTLCNKSDTCSKAHLNKQPKSASNQSKKDSKQDSKTSGSKANINKQLTLFND